MTQNLPIRAEPQYIAVEERSPKNRLVAVTLGCIFGYLGLHRFYTGKFWTGLLMFLTGGGFTIWWIIDALMLLAGRFKDADGRVLGPPAKVARPPAGYLPSHSAPPPAKKEDDPDLDSLLDDPLEEEFRKLEADMNGK